MTTKYAAQIQIRKNRQMMRGLPENSPTWKSLKKENDALGQVGMSPELSKRSQQWTEVADILASLAFGDGQEYSKLEANSVYRALIAQETDRIFKLLT